MLLWPPSSSGLSRRPRFRPGQRPSNGGFTFEAIWSVTTVAHVDGEHANGATYGVGAGYDFQAGRAVFGIEGEATDSISRSLSTGLSSPATGLRRRCAATSMSAAASARWSATRTLIYAKAGYTNARARVSYDDGTSGTRSDFTDHQQSRRHPRRRRRRSSASAANAYLRTEYRYSNYRVRPVDRHQVVGAPRLPLLSGA